MTNTLENTQTTEPELRKTMLVLPPEVATAFADPSTDTESRDKYIAALRSAGWTLQSISDVSGLTRERIRQIVRGYTESDIAGLLAGPVPTPPAKPVKVPRVYVEPDPAKLARLLELQPLARRSRGTGSKNQPAADEYVALLWDLHSNDGVPIYRLALRLDVTHGALRSRLTRYGLLDSSTYTSKAYTPLIDSDRRASVFASV